MFDASRSEFLGMLKETRIVSHSEPSTSSTPSPKLEPDPY
jgi:hypothetical protein